MNKKSTGYQGSNTSNNRILNERFQIERRDQLATHDNSDLIAKLEALKTKKNTK